MCQGVSQSQAWSWSHFGPLVHTHDEAFGHREMHCRLAGSLATCGVMAGAGAGSRAGQEREMQLDPTIPDWLLMGFLPSSSSSGTPVVLIGARAATWCWGQCNCKSGKESIEVGCPVTSKVGDRSQNSCTQNNKKLLIFLLTVSQIHSYLRIPIVSICIGAVHRP